MEKLKAVVRSSALHSIVKRTGLFFQFTTKALDRFQREEPQGYDDFFSETTKNIEKYKLAEEAEIRVPRELQNEVKETVHAKLVNGKILDLVSRITYVTYTGE